jgi:ubiquinone/menaquinone biosynthesis C-methylase UbiE
VAEQIASIGTEVVDAVHTPLRDATVIDLACGTGNAALAAAALGARVTAVDITPELLALGEQRAGAAGLTVTWVTGDAADTGLPAQSCDALVSNMGIIFVEPTRVAAELARLLRPGGRLSFSAWAHGTDNPFFTPIVAVLGPPPPRDFYPDEWSDPDTATARLGADFDDLHLETRAFTWRFESLEAAVRFVTLESPTHVEVLRQAGESHRDELVAAFEDAMRAHLHDGAVSFPSPYVVVTARRR